jgi:hypothetical protein
MSWRLCSPKKRENKKTQEESERKWPYGKGENAIRMCESGGQSN